MFLCLGMEKQQNFEKLNDFFSENFCHNDATIKNATKKAKITKCSISKVSVNVSLATVQLLEYSEA